MRRGDDAAHVLGIVAHLEVDEIDAVVRADRVVEPDDALVVEARSGSPPSRIDRRVRMIGVSPAALRIARATSSDRRRIGDAFEVIDAPLDDVGPLREDARRFSENASRVRPTSGVQMSGVSPPSFLPLTSMIFSGMVAL